MTKDVWTGTFLAPAVRLVLKLHRDFPLLIRKISVKQRVRKSKLFPGIQHEISRKHWEGLFSLIYTKIANDDVNLAGKVTVRGWPGEACSGKHLPGSCHSLSATGAIWWQGFWNPFILSFSAPRGFLSLSENRTLGPHRQHGVQRTLPSGAENFINTDLDLVFLRKVTSSLATEGMASAKLSTRKIHGENNEEHS